MFINKISRRGEVLVSFTQNLIIPANYSDVLNDTALEVLVIPGDGSEASLCKITGWNVTDFSSTGMTIQLLFENTNYISLRPDEEHLSITVLEPSMFISRQTFLTIKNETESVVEIPP